MDYNYDYYDSAVQSSNTDPAVTAAIIVTIIFTFLIVTLIAYAAYAFLLGRLFAKAGVPQWAAWVPIYNNWKTLEIGDQKGYWSMLGLIPFVGIVFVIFLYIAMYHIGKKLGKEDWFVFLAIFLPFIWLIWLAFDDSKWPKGKHINAQSSAKA